MVRPTISPRDTVSHESLYPGGKRRTEVINFGQLLAPDNFMLLRGGAEAPQITYVGITGNVSIGHEDAEADTWIFDLINSSSGATLNVNAASLSGVTLAATAFKSIPVNNGNSTLKDGDGLQIQITESGGAFTMDQCQVVVQWVPTSES